MRQGTSRQCLARCREAGIQRTPYSTQHMRQRSFVTQGDGASLPSLRAVRRNIRMHGRKWCRTCRRCCASGTASSTRGTRCFHVPCCMSHASCCCMLHVACCIGCCMLHLACVGHKVLFRVGCALLKIHQDGLLKMRDMMDAMQYLQKHVPQSCNIDRTLHVRTACRAVPRRAVPRRAVRVRSQSRAHAATVAALVWHGRTLPLDPVA